MEEEIQGTVEYTELDPGIRKTVQALREMGFNTTDSGDGVSKGTQVDDMGMAEVLSIAHVHCRVAPADGLSESKRLAEELLSRCNYQAQPGQIQLTYDPVDNIAVLSLLFVGDAELFGAAAE